MDVTPNHGKPGRLSRRNLVLGALGGGAFGVAGTVLHTCLNRRERQAATFIAKADSYAVDLASRIGTGLVSLGVRSEAVRGKTILLKPNLVETVAGARHICTQPEVILGAAQAWQRLGAGRILVGEGSGHCRDTLRVVEETGLAAALREHRIEFVDLNSDDMVLKRNAACLSGLDVLTFPAVVEQVDWIVSMAKMKTHHLAGLTLSLKNLFGLMPGLVYGWPKNVFHWGGNPPGDSRHPRHGPTPLRHSRRHRGHGRRWAHHGNPQARGGPGPGSGSGRRGRHRGTDHGH